MIKTSLSLTVFLALALPAEAYPLVSAECKNNVAACIKAGKLAFVSIYGEIGDEDLEFFKVLDETLPHDFPFPRVFLNSYGGSVSAGLGIGRILRKHQATAESGSPIIPDTTPQCTSACVIVAQGAYHRRLTHIGLHSASVRIQTAPNVWEEQKGYMGDIRSYMTEMGAAFATNLLMDRTGFLDVANFFFDPELSAEGQPIFFELHFYDISDLYFTASQFTYPDDFRFAPSEDYRINAAIYGSVQAIRDQANYHTTYYPDEKPDFAEASRWLEMAAAKGDAMSIHRLGYYYAYGLGVAQEKTKAAELYLKAAKLGFAGSQNNIGWAYYLGEGVRKSLNDAIYWIGKSAEQGEPFAYGSLCEISGATDLFNNDPTEAFMWCGLAVHYLEDGAAKDASQAVYDRIMKTITPANYAAGSLQIQKWQAEKETFSTMRNVGDDLN